jgi:ribosomal protein S18 acetylase RimI-like enzyme
MGVICMATLEHYRRRGAATAILHVLAASAAERGAQKMYLQVMQENQPACRAYERAGFRPLYDYWYREIDRSATVDSCD